MEIAFRGSKEQIKGFYGIFVVGGNNFRIMKIVFLAFFEAKVTKIVILDQKLIVPNDYQQFWVHFDWFLSIANYRWNYCLRNDHGIFDLIIPIYQLFMIYKGRVNNKVW